MNRQQNFPNPPITEHRKRRTHAPHPPHHHQPFKPAIREIHKEHVKKHDITKQIHPFYTTKKGVKKKQSKNEIKSRNTNKWKSRNSTPLMFSPPRIQDRQIKHIKNSENLLEDENKGIEGRNEQANIELPDILNEALPIEKPINQSVTKERNHPPKTTEKEFSNIANGQENDSLLNESKPNEIHDRHHSQRVNDSDIDVESIASTMKDFVKQHLNSLKELNIQDDDEKAAAQCEETPARKAEALVEESAYTKTETMDEEVYEQKENRCFLDGDKHFASKILPSVKLPVLLAVIKVDIDIFENISLPVPVKMILESDWEIHSFDLQVLLPSRKAFVKGVLTANIDYLQDHGTESLHHYKMNIPWNKIIEIDWHHPPELSNSIIKEYMFHSEHHLEVQSHYESIKKFSETVFYELKQQHSVWTYELFFKGEERPLEIQGTFTLNIQLFQNQLVSLNKEACHLI